MARGFWLEHRWRREWWASAGRDVDRIPRSRPDRTAPAPRPLARDVDETDEVHERWTIDDLDPLRHDERRIR